MHVSYRVGSFHRRDGVCSKRSGRKADATSVNALVLNALKKAGREDLIPVLLGSVRHDSARGAVHTSAGRRTNNAAKIIGEKTGKRK